MMIRLLVLILGIAAVSNGSPRTIVGTWCVQGQDLEITFKKGDSLLVSSNGEAGINGTGRYTMTDTGFVATVTNGQVTVELGYQYRRDSDSVIAARPKFVKVNKESMDFPQEWVRMSLCGKRSPAETAPPAAGTTTKKKAR